MQVSHANHNNRTATPRAPDVDRETVSHRTLKGVRISDLDPDREDRNGGTRQTDRD